MIKAVVSRPNELALGYVATCSRCLRDCPAISHNGYFGYFRLCYLCYDYLSEQYYQVAYRLVAEIDRHMTLGTRHYYAGGVLLWSLDQVVEALRAS